MKKELVIATFNDEVSWTEKIDSVDRITIYNKGSREIRGSIRLPNIGREAHSFAYHIAENYDSLADHVIFLQGFPFDHAPQINAGNIAAAIANHQYKDCREPAFNGRTADSSSLIEDATGLSKRTYERYFEEVPEKIHFSPGAQWIVPAKDIRSKSRRFYMDLFVQLSTPRINPEDGIVNPWNMEGLWNYIFDPEVKEKQIYGDFDPENESPYYRIAHDPKMKYDFVKSTFIDGQRQETIWDTYVKFQQQK